MGICVLYSFMRCNSYEITQNASVSKMGLRDFSVSLLPNFMKDTIFLQLSSPIRSIWITGLYSLELKISIWGRAIFFNNNILYETLHPALLDRVGSGIAQI